MKGHDLPPLGTGVGTQHAGFDGILAHISLEASLGESLDEVLKRIVDCIVERMPIAIASIILLNEQQSHFVQEVCAGLMDLAPPSDGLWPVSMGATGRCVRSGAPQLITDVMNDPDYVPGNQAVQAEYLVPIRHRERLLGVLNLESTQRDFFTDEARATCEGIARQVAGSIYLARVVRELEKANQRLEQMSRQDGLTGIANRRCFDEALARAWASHARSGLSLGLVLIDIDYFKGLNDACGHVFADECLRDLARLCAASARRDDDLVARYGGEEFVILLPGCELAEARRIAELLRQRVQANGMPHPGSEVADCLTISAGVAALRPRAGDAPERLVQQADRALYEAKQKGRNRVMASF